MVRELDVLITYHPYTNWVIVRLCLREGECEASSRMVGSVPQWPFASETIYYLIYDSNVSKQ